MSDTYKICFLGYKKLGELAHQVIEHLNYSDTTIILKECSIETLVQAVNEAIKNKNNSYHYLYCFMFSIYVFCSSPVGPIIKLNFVVAHELNNVNIKIRIIFFIFFIFKSKIVKFFNHFSKNSYISNS